MKRFVRILLALTLGFLIGQAVLISSMAQGKLDFTSSLKEEQLTSITGIVQRAIATDHIPGAVILIGNQEKSSTARPSVIEPLYPVSDP